MLVDSTVFHPFQLLILLALCGCGLTKASPSPTPSPTVTPRPSRLPDPVEEIGCCSSGEVAAPNVIDTWSPPPEAASITPLSCDEIREVFACDPQASTRCRIVLETLPVTEAAVPATYVTKEHNCRTRKDATAEGDEVLSRCIRKPDISL
jgi:hypothetical protein